MEDKEPEQSITPDSEKEILPTKKLGNEYDRKGRRAPLNPEYEKGGEVDKKI